MLERTYDNGKGGTPQTVPNPGTSNMGKERLKAKEDRANSNAKANTVPRADYNVWGHSKKEKRGT